MQAFEGVRVWVEKGTGKARCRRDRIVIGDRVMVSLGRFLEKPPTHRSACHFLEAATPTSNKTHAVEPRRAWQIVPVDLVCPASGEQPMAERQVRKIKQKDMNSVVVV